MKGQGNIIIAILFFSILILSVIPLTIHIYYALLNNQQLYENPITRRVSIAMKEMSRDIRAFLNTSSSELYLTNIGGTDIEIEKAILHISCENTNHYIDTHIQTTIKSGQTVLISIPIPSLCQNQRTVALHLITVEGSVISSTVLTPEDLQKIQSQLFNTTIPIGISSAIQVIPMKLAPNDEIWNISIFRKSFNISTLDNMDNPTRISQFTDLGKGMSGGTTTKYIWRLQNVYTNTEIIINNLNIRNLWIGYDPRNTSRYNILITADRITSNTLSIGGTGVTTNTYTRIKIYGFTPSSPREILRLGGKPITRPSQDVADYTFNNSALVLRGRADRIEIYVRSTGSESSYNPYIMLMNTDKSSGSAGILFTSIDRTRGNITTRNEGVDSLLDYSTQALVLVYRDYVVSNYDSSAVVIAVNYRFHDNEGSDATGISVDRPIMLVGLVDENGAIYSYRSYTFRELTRYEDTYPPTAQAQSSLVFIPLPPRETGEKKFYVFIAIQDPYHYNGNLDDLDFTLYIESLSILPMR
ncbi:MAG: hypothetical protein QXX89_02705 [Ignisphaera sp.]